LRGVRQGDPLSPALFNNVTARMLDKLRAKWERRKLGTVIGCDSDIQLDRHQHNRLSHLLFADDTTLIAKSKSALVEMISDFLQALSELGLNVNCDKCKVQTNRALRSSSAFLCFDGHRIPIVPRSEGFKILGAIISVNVGFALEFANRIACGWGKFHSLRKLLCRRSCSLKRRLKLFDATVSKTVLWCTESWNLSKDQLRELQSTQNEMLRRIIGQKRRPDEDWVLWVKRTTRHARILVESYNISLWSATHLEKKWCWAGKVARMSETC